jgi:autotransporter-associated beta strand protein
MAGLCGKYALASPPAGNFKLIFDDEFNGNSLDTNKWSYNYPTSFPNNGHTHNHQAYMEASQDIVSGGRLNLQGINQVDPNAPANYSYGGVSYPLNYTSGAVNTASTFNFGPDPNDSSSEIYVEASMQMPGTEGNWPAFWMLQSGWPPEIDIMEFPYNTTSSDSNVNSAYQYHATWHYGTGSDPLSAGTTVGTSNLTTGFNTYGLLWTHNTLTFYFNGTAEYSTSASVSQATKMYLILDNAIGGWPGTPPANAGFPSNFQTDWVRVWQTHPVYGGVATSSTSVWNVNGGGSFGNYANWTGIIPEFQDQIAQFVPVGNAATAPITWTGPVVMGGMVFGDPNNVTATTTSYTIGNSGGEITIDNSSGTALIHTMSTAQVNQTIASQLELLTNTTFQNDSTSATTVISGSLVGTGNLTKTGVGVLELTGNNDLTGTVNVGSGSTSGGNVNGALMITSTGSLAGVTQVKINDNNTANSILQLDAMNGNVNLPSTTAFSINANTAANGTSIAATQVENVYGNNIINGAWTCNVGGAGYGFQSDQGYLLLFGNFRLSSGSANKTLFLRGAGNGIFYGGIGIAGAASFSIDVLGTGTWSLNGSNVYTGSTTINSGTLEIGGAGGLPSGANVSNGGNFLLAANTTAGTVSDISSGGTAITTVNSNVTFTVARLTQGGLVNNGAVTINNAATIGAVSGAGEITVPSGASLTAGAFTQGALVNNGTTTINGNGVVGPISGSGSLIIGTGSSDNTLQLATNSGLIQLPSLTIATGSSFDLTNNHLIINYGASDPFSTIVGYVQSGYNGGAWNGPGIVSSVAVTPTNGLWYGLGYADGKDGVASGLSSGQIEVMYTLLGDANLDGLVNAADFTILAANFNQPVTGWDQGDFNYDGLVNAADFTDLAANFNQSDSGAAVSAGDVAALDAFAAANGLLADVPEPASIASVGILSVALLIRRRRSDVTGPRLPRGQARERVSPGAA